MKLTTLSSGLRVASRQMPGIETAAVGLYAETGSRYEAAPLNGIAHLFEHMVFKGAGGRSARDISEAIEDVGGDLNASTDRETTNFTASVMAEHIPLGVEMIADLVQRPHFNAGELEREKDVVLQELGEARDTPNDIIFDDLQSAAFAEQALGRSVLGTEESIEAIQVDDLEAWRSSHYRAGSLTLVAAGKVDHDRLVDLAEKHFADLTAGSSDTPDPARFTGGDRVGRTSSDQAHLALGFGAPGQTHEDYYAARLFSDAVGGGMSSRLFQQLREERGLAYSVYSMLQPWADTGLFSIYAATARRQSAAAAQLIEEILADAAETITERELQRVRTQARAGLLMSLESPWGQAHYVARQIQTYGRLVEPAEVIADVDKVDLDRIRAAGRAMLSGPRARATIGFPAVRAA
ncbi:pitrilysin family protein [Sphingosinicella sp. BN140058]|uniref:M16 family metallopeptidase n=1 Tax=Sphingosinicella sp. BN140058 TaxID=1892855 RepID=UPI0010134C59|nr:pitrilysin family protein [Sphingosinicella sp. BN140058]QAY77453.1 insulinase family protein [Sphingosinicella sp. BN140058]